MDEYAAKAGEVPLAKCETVAKGNNTPLDLKNTQQSSFMN